MDKISKHVLLFLLWTCRSDNYPYPHISSRSLKNENNLGTIQTDIFNLSCLAKRQYLQSLW